MMNLQRSFPWLATHSNKYNENESNRQLLLEKRDRLKVLIKRTQDDINKLKDEIEEEIEANEYEDIEDHHGILKKLLDSNDSEILFTTEEDFDINSDENDHNKEVTNDINGNNQQTNQLDNSNQLNQLNNHPNNNLSESSFLPIRNTTQAEFLFSIFHSLTFKKLTSKLIARNIAKSEFIGSCYHNSTTIFNFAITLSVKLPQERVLSFKILTSPWIKQEIGDFINQMQEKRNISSCLYGLAQYANMSSKRHKVFLSLIEKYHLNKRPPRSNFIILSNSITLRWTIHIDQLGNIKSNPTISLKPSDQIPPKILTKYPSIFKSLLIKKGVFNATCIFYDLINNI